MIKAVIFDMDGVLIDAKDWHFEALNKALDIFGFQISRYEHATTFDGLPTKKKLQLLSAEENLPEGLHEFINELKQIYTTEIVLSRCKPKFHHQYLMAKLKSLDYRLAVASNSVRASIELMLGKAELIDFFEFFLSNQDVRLAKPDPEIYNLAIARLGLSANECLIVEDNQNGIRAARASGARVLEVSHVDEVNWTNLKAAIDLCQQR